MGEGSIDKSFGGAPSFSTLDLTNSAWNEVNKAALGIVKERDTIDQVFTQISPRYQFGYLGGFGYKTNPDRPLLDHNLETARVLGASKTAEDNAWEVHYDNLVKKLPDDVRPRFEEQMKLPFEERNFAWIALDQGLRATSRALAGLDRMTRPVQPGSLEEARMVSNNLLPFTGISNALVSAGEIGTTAEEFLTNQGPNYRDFDALNNVLSSVHGSLASLNRVREHMGQIKFGEELSPEYKLQAGDAASQLGAAREQYRLTSHTGDMQIFDSTLGAYELFASALSLPYSGSAPLYLGLSIANIGIGTHSESGFVGSSFGSITGGLFDGISGTLPHGNAASTRFGEMLTSAGLYVGIGLGSLISENGLGPLPGAEPSDHFIPWIDPSLLGAFAVPVAASDMIAGFLSATVIAICIGWNLLAAEDWQERGLANPADISMARFYIFNLVLQLAANSNIIQEYFKEVIALAGGDEKAQAQVVPILTQVAMIFIALAATGKDKRYGPAKVLEGHAAQLEQGVESAVALSEGRDDSEQGKAVSVMVGQLQRALQENNFEGFLESFNTILESMGSSQNALMKDVDAIRQMINTLITTANDKDDEMSRIGIVNVV